MKTESEVKRSRKPRKEEDTEWAIRDVILSKETVRKMLIDGINLFIIFIAFFIFVLFIIYYKYVVSFLIG